MIDGFDDRQCEVFVRAGPLDGLTPFGDRLNDGDFKPADTTNDAEVLVSSSFSLIGMIS